MNEVPPFWMKIGTNLVKNQSMPGIIDESMTGEIENCGGGLPIFAAQKFFLPKYFQK